MKKRILVIALALTLAFSVLSACSDEGVPASTPGRTAAPSTDPIVEDFKNAALNFYPSKTIRQAFGSFLTNVQWESLVADDGNTYVNISGGALYDDEPVELLVQFLVNDDDTYEFYAIEMDDVPYDFYLYFELVTKSYENEIISIVRDGTLSGYPGQVMGDAFNSFLEDIEWEVIASDDFEVLVNVSGYLLYNDELAWAVLQYWVDTVELTFEYNAFEINGIPQADYMYFELIELVFE